MIDTRRWSWLHNYGRLLVRALAELYRDVVRYRNM